LPRGANSPPIFAEAKSLRSVNARMAIESPAC
jgi:hypothetical protein